MGKTIYRGILIIFITFWICFILLDYWQHHPNYGQITRLFQYTDLFIVLSLSAGLTYFVLFMSTLSAKIKILKSGLGIFFLGLILVLLTLLFYLIKTIGLGTLTPGNFFQYIGKLLLTSAECFLIVWSAHSYGKIVLNKLFNQDKNNAVLASVNIATGIMIIVYLTFFAAAAHVLKWYAVLPILIFPLLIKPKLALNFLKFCTIEQHKISSKFNIFGFLSFFLLLWLVSINFVQILGPMPLGWDSLTLYANIPNLLNDYQALVKGFQPYNWSLFMSIGLVGFDSTELMLAMSYLGGILSLFVMYGVFRHYFKSGINFTLFGLLLFYCIPSVGLQSFLELKVDLGLLFVLLCVFALFLDWLIFESGEEVNSSVKSGKTAFFKPKAKKEKKYRPGIDAHIITMGLLSGFAFGIKFTTLFSFFALLAGIWYVLFNGRAFLGIFLICFAAILIVKLDDFSGLRSFHLSVDILQWLILAGGVVLLIGVVRDDVKKVLRAIRISFLYGFFFFIPFLPWATKNYLEARQLNVDALLNGKKDSPALDIRELDKNMKKGDSE